MKQAVTFIKEAYNELKRVAWPSKAETKRLTMYVLGVSFAVALFVWGFDILFGKLFSYLLIK